MAWNWQVTLDAMRVMLLRRGRTSEDVDDLVQEAWLRYAVYQRERPVASPGAFLVRTVQNLAINADRARAVRGEEVAVEELSLVDPSPGTEDTVLGRERLARMDACLHRLESKTRAILLDIRLGGMSFDEAAEVHQISVSGVEKRVAQATAKIARWMEGWLQ
jgi:RNA polymerase sigma-70 factor (ECF subfamily)